MHILINHPCVQHKLAVIRDIDTGHKKFRELATEITEFLCYEALKNIEMKEVEVQTPLAVASCQMIGTDIVVVPILRAGIGMLEGILELVPTARVGFVGLYRDEETKQPVTYYETFPPADKERHLHHHRPDAGDRRLDGGGHRSAQAVWRAVDRRHLYRHLPGGTRKSRRRASRRPRLYSSDR